MEAEVRRWQQDAHDAKRETRLLKKKAREQVRHAQRSAGQARSCRSAHGWLAENGIAFREAARQLQYRPWSTVLLWSAENDGCNSNQTCLSLHFCVPKSDCSKFMLRVALVRRRCGSHLRSCGSRRWRGRRWARWARRAVRWRWWRGSSRRRATRRRRWPWRASSSCCTTRASPSERARSCCGCKVAAAQPAGKLFLRVAGKTGQEADKTPKRPPRVWRKGQQFPAESLLRAFVRAYRSAHRVSQP